jgi:xylose isomerase
MNEFFPGVPRISYEGPSTKNPFAFRHYQPGEKVEGKTMREHLRFAAAYWHVMRNPLSDPFGPGTALMPWDDGSNSVANAKQRVSVFFEFLKKTGIDFYCFHDRDVAPEMDSLAESNRALDEVVHVLAAEQERTGKKLLWGTACLFSHPRYAQGAATSPSLPVFAHAAAQVKKAIEVTHRLGGGGYVFWGGREGYSTLWNTDMKRELDHLAAFLHMAVAWKKEIGFTGRFLIEPKPRAPSTHQYDSDAAACLNFLREYGLLDEFALNIETNHATLAGHSMEHELRAAIAAGALGSIDANMGTPGLGWDTDRFPTDIALTSQVMLAVLDMGGFTTGGLNFDAKRRRESFTPADLVIAHLAGMDAFAAGLKVAAALRADGRLAAFVRDRYASWQGELGRRILSRGVNLAELHRLAHESGPVEPVSGRQEMLEDIVNQVTIRALR